MNKTLLACALSLASMGSAIAGSTGFIVPVNLDPAGSGLNDTTPATPVGGNPGTTKGEQRRYVAAYAAALWGSVLQSDVPVFVQARFLSLAPGVLGSAGATFVNRDFANAPVAGTW